MRRHYSFTVGSVQYHYPTFGSRLFRKLALRDISRRRREQIRFATTWVLCGLLAGAVLFWVLEALRG